MGKAVSKVWHKVEHGVENVGKDIGKGAEDAVHGVDKAVTFVGDQAAHLIHHIPLVGGVIARGIHGVTDLAHLQSKVYSDVLHAACHPENTIDAATKIVSSPAAALHAMRSISNSAAITANRVSKDVSQIGTVVSLVNPALGEELNAAAKTAALISAGSRVINNVTHGNVTGAVNAGVKTALFSSGEFEQDVNTDDFFQFPLAAYIPYACNKTARSDWYWGLLDYITAYVPPGATMVVHMYDANNEWIGALELCC